MGRPVYGGAEPAAGEAAISWEWPFGEIGAVEGAQMPRGEAESFDWPATWGAFDDVFEPDPSSLPRRLGHAITARGDDARWQTFEQSRLVEERFPLPIVGSSRIGNLFWGAETHRVSGNLEHE